MFVCDFVFHKFYLGGVYMFAKWIVKTNLFYQAAYFIFVILTFYYLTCIAYNW